MQLKIWLTFLLVSLAAYGSYAGWRVYQATHLDRGEAVSRPHHIERACATGSLDDAALVDTSGKPFALDALKGDVWIASFFFTACPGPCAQMNRALSELQKDEKDPHLKFVSITCDPTNDTPEVLAKYARAFQADPARWSFLSGPFESVQKLGTEAFQVPVGPKMHTERVILVDKFSNVRGLYLTSDPSQVLALKKKIKKLLVEETPPKVTEEPDTAAGEATPSAASDDAASEQAAATENENPAHDQSAAPATTAAPAEAAPDESAPSEAIP